MKMTELEINIMAVPQGYYLAHAISRDFNFKSGLPAQFDKQFNLANKLKNFYGENFTIGAAYLTDNVYSLTVKDSSYDMPDRYALMDALTEMHDDMEERMVTKLAIPRICCGRNGLDWDDVKAMIEAEFKDSNVEILVCIQ